MIFFAPTSLPSDCFFKISMSFMLITKLFKMTFKALHDLAPACLLTVISCSVPYTSTFFFYWRFLKWPMFSHACLHKLSSLL